MIPLQPLAAFTGTEFLWIGFVLIVLFAIPLLILIAILRAVNSPNKAPRIPPVQKSVQERLATIDDLRSQNRITEAEYEEKRKQILADV